MRNSILCINRSAGRCHSIAAHLPDRCGTSRDDGVSSFTQLKNQQPATLCLHRRYRLTIRRKFSSPPAPPPTERCGDYPLQPALRWILLRWQCALRDDDVYLTVMPAFHTIASVLRRWRRFLPGPPLCWREIQRPRLLGTGAEVPRHRYECIPMMIRTLMVQPPSANDRNTACGK